MSRWFSDPPVWLVVLAVTLMVALAIWRLATGPGLLDGVGVLVLASGAALIVWGFRERLRRRPRYDAAVWSG